VKKNNTLSKPDFYLTLITLCVATAFFAACTSTGVAPRDFSLFSGGVEISAQGALGRVEAAPQGPLYAGDGGRDIKLAILAPEIQGAVPDYLPVYIQGLLNNDFSRYSAIGLIDRQNLDRIILEQDMAASGRFSDEDFVTIGNLTNTQYFLFGTIQKLSGERYALQLAITDSSTGLRRANFIRDASLAQLERGTFINEAAADLLLQIGVELTEMGRRTLIAGNTSVARAEAGLARGISAQAVGDEVEALFNITQAITFDPSNLEALSRLSTLSSEISGGTVSQRIVNDIQARNRWLEVFRETTRFFDDHPPFEIIFDPNLEQIGQTNYTRNTANIGMRIELSPSEAGFAALNTLLEGLEKTGMRETWGFSGWPLSDITPRTPGTVVFGGRRSFSFKVDVELLNAAQKTLGKSSVTFNTSAIPFSPGNRSVVPPNSLVEMLHFSNVRAEDLTPSLTIVITAVNGISSRDLNASGYMKIETGDLRNRQTETERKAVEEEAQRAQRERESAVRLAQAQLEREEAARREQQNRTQRERETSALQTKLKQRWAEWPGLLFKSGVIGYNYVPEMPLGFSLGISGLYTSLNFDGIDFEKFSGRAEATIGYSIPIIKSLRIPIGFGGLYNKGGPITITKPNGTVFETGLRFFFADLFYISSTYRLRFGDYKKNVLTFGAGLGGYMD